ncbi:hypothetical protein SNEBB_000635 [Seison nebaliae]|nr:hypothetical protein SNEBB_000635 [Seison nebaliae]
MSILPESCGISSLRRITNGVQTSAGRWPWIISLQMNNNHLCGGSLIHERLVVTAAHCFGRSRNPKSYQVVTGALNLRNRQIRRIPVAKLEIHQNFKRDRWSMAHDIALIKLSCAVPFTNSPKSERDLHPICISPVGKKFDRNICFAAGWGALRMGGNSVPDLREVKLTIQDSQSVCANVAGRRNTVNVNYQTCATASKRNEDTCFGDSGGPLICRDGSKWYLHGLTSFGEGCGLRGTVYTRVASYLKWIAETKRKMGV